MSYRKQRGDEGEEDRETIRFRNIFKEVSGPDMEVDAWELRDILNSALRQDLRRERFSLESCKSMVALSDDDRTGKLSFDEFKELWDNICEIKDLFQKADADNSGMINKNEMRIALASLGYKLRTDIIKGLGLTYGDKDGNLSLANFIHAVIRVKYMHIVFESNCRGDKARFKPEEFLVVQFYS